MLVTVKDLREALMREPNQNKLVYITDGLALEVMVKKLYSEKRKSIYKEGSKEDATR